MSNEKNKKVKTSSHVKLGKQTPMPKPVTNQTNTEVKPTDKK
jgi:hypothetical protein